MTHILFAPQMSIISVGFILFICLVFLCYYLAPKRFRVLVLFIANPLFMYLCGGWFSLLFLSISIVSTYLGARAIAYFREKANGLSKDASDKIASSGPGSIERKIRLVFWLTLGLNFFLLILIKYIPSGFTSLPDVIGISFYTLSISAYLIDVYWGGITPQKSFVRFAVFAGFFPALISGPIYRYQELMPQIDRGEKPTYMNLTRGAQRILWGFFKKLVISERLAVMVNTVYGDPDTFSGLYLILATALFAFQLYTDFSGCMDIVIGSGEILGLRLPENFDTPFASKTESELWRRWHITLGLWFKDYVMYPILKSKPLLMLRSASIKRFGRKKGKKIAPWAGMLILWFLIGYWHGGGLKYIVGSGLLHGTYMILGEILTPMAHRINLMLHVKEGGYLNRGFQRIRTFLCLCSGFVFFRAASFQEAIHIYRNMFTGNTSVLTKEGLLAMGLDGKDLLVLILSMVCLSLASYLHRRFSLRNRVGAMRFPVRWVFYIAMFVMVALLGMYGSGYSAESFIYARF